MSTSATTSTKQAQIQRAARTLLLARGYAATSMDAVAAEAGVSKQTLYAYYTGKEELAGDVLRGLAAEGRAVPPPRTELPADPSAATGGCPDDARGAAPRTRDELVDLAERLCAVRGQPDQLAMVRLVVAEAPRYPRLAEQFRTIVVEQGRDVTARTLTELAPGARPERLRLAAELLTSFLFTTTVFERLVEPDRQPPPRPDLAAVVDLLVAGLQHDGAGRGTGADRGSGDDPGPGAGRGPEDGDVSSAETAARP